MGNINSLRDWGHAKDYVEMQWLMLQQENPNDYIISSGKQYSVKTFIIWASNVLGIKIEFKGSGIEEVGVIVEINGDLAPKVDVGQEIIKIDPRYFRPTEVDSLIGDYSKAKKELKWEPKITAQQMCEEMVREDYKSARRHSLLKANDLELPLSIEK
jgi:GDPmannose 4,6-dehydratase